MKSAQKFFFCYNNFDCFCWQNLSTKNSLIKYKSCFKIAFRNTRAYRNQGNPWQKRVILNRLFFQFMMFYKYFLYLYFFKLWIVVCIIILLLIGMIYFDFWRLYLTFYFRLIIIRFYCWQIKLLIFTGY